MKDLHSEQFNDSRYKLIQQAAENKNNSSSIPPANLIHAMDAQFINEMKQRIPEELLGKILW